MRATSAVKFPWSKLHLPLPRTPRQSKQLLNAITSSFRRQLDREYPTNNPSSSNRADVPEEHLPAKSNSSAHSMDRLMHNILNNPLFRVSPSESAISSNAAGMREIKNRRMVTEPMVVFEELAAAGHVEHKDMYLCLQYQLMLAIASGDVVKAMKDSRAGTKVVNWWRASNWDDRLSLFCNRTIRSSKKSQRTSTTLVKFMVAEGMQDTVLRWWEMLATSDIRDSSGYISRDRADPWASCLLADLIAAETQYGGGLASAMRFYVQAKDMYFSLIPSDRHAPGRLFCKSGEYIFYRLLRGVSDDKSKIPASLYSEYVSMLSPMEHSKLITSSLALYHPTEPDPRPFLHFVRDFDIAALQALPRRRRRVFVQSCSDAIRILMDWGKRRDATWLADVLRHVLDEQKVGHEATASADKKSSLFGLLKLELALT